MTRTWTTAIVVLILSFAAQTQAQYECAANFRDVAQELYRPKAVLQEWSANKFTRAKGFDSSKPYLFLTHAMSSAAKAVDLIKEPQSLANNPYISAALVSHEKGATYGAYGLILRPAPQNILAAYWTDMAIGLKPEHTTRQVTDHLTQAPLYAPQKILENTGKYPSGPDAPVLNYNEVIVGGRGLNGKKIQVEGFFVTLHSDGTPVVKPQRYQEIKEQAKKHGLPLVHLPKRDFDIESDSSEIFRGPEDDDFYFDFDFLP